MTKSIKITTLIASVLLLIGTLFKISHWPGANILIIIGAAISVLLFILLIFTVPGKLSKGFEQFNLIFASLTIIVALLAFVFKVLHLSGAAILIWIADIGILLSAAFFLIDGMQEKDTAKWIIKIIAGFFILFLMLVLMLAG